VNHNSAVPSKFRTRNMRAIPNAPIIIDTLRVKLIKVGGMHGLREFQHVLRTIGSECLTKDELEVYLSTFRSARGVISFKEADLEVIWKYFDPLSQGTVRAESVVGRLAVPVNGRRGESVTAAFDALTAANDGGDELPMSFFLKNYSGGASRDFSRQWDAQHHPTGVVTSEDFSTYYAQISPFFDDDSEFESWLQSSWEFAIEQFGQKAGNVKVRVFYKDGGREVVSIPASAVCLDAPDDHRALVASLAALGIRNVEKASTI